MAGGVDAVMDDHDVLCTDDPCQCVRLLHARERAIRDCILALEVDDMHSLDPSWDGTNWNNAVDECKEILRALLEET